jgi:predicted ATPase
MREALAHIEDTGERYYEAEVYRLNGELLLKKDTAKAPAAAETSFLQAREIARRQNARAWELRAATSLARCWCESGRSREAREVLSSISGWFTEGFDMPDLQDAESLLKGLPLSA